ncbi:MAG: hypothetical protein L7S55_11020, partial [Luminiphilus sp.]|nr:hypothetical protein [Luminiphilus sp.]
RAVKAFAVAIDPTIAPVNVPSRGFEALMADDSPPSLEIIISMATGAALLGVLFALPYTLPRVEQVNERKQVLARMKDRAFTPRDHGERGEHTFMNLGRPIGCLWEHATRAALIITFAVGFLLWSDNASAESDVIFFCCVVYPLLALGYATVEFVSSSNRFITNHRVIQSTTFFFPREDLYAESVSAMEVRPSIFGVLFGYGTLRISMGDKVYEMHYVKDARTVKSTWEKLRA